MLAIVNVSHLVEVSGYPLLFAAVMAESAGVPVPGETGLITAGVLASRGRLQIEFVIATAALAAIVGDNIGYLIGRKGGRWLLERPGRFQRHRMQVLLVGEPLFERHGPKAVFFGRFVLGLRTWASWIAGATQMRWRSFLLWNALGGICWATGIGLLAYFLGKTAENAIEEFGIYGLIAVVLTIAGAFVMYRRHHHELAPPAPQEEAAAGAGDDPGAGDARALQATREPDAPG
jgi:membrane protein DedA with SNARE-associated domain